MSDEMGLEIQGMREALNSLQSISSEVDISSSRGKRLIGRALAAAAVPVKEEAERRAPYDPAIDNRVHLRDEIVVRVSVRDSSRSDEASASVGFTRDAFWGMFSEFGTVNQPAQPFLRPALDDRQDEAVRIFGDYMRRGVEKIVAKEQRKLARRG